MNKFAAMETFLRIVDAGSLTAAAESLGKALPTVVRSLATLEASLGVRLLNRTTRRMSLTDEGRLYVERCRRILADVEDAERALTDQQTEPRGFLRVTAPVRFGERYVAPALFDFLARHPRMQVELLLLDRIVDLVDEGIDLAVRIASPEDSTLVATRIGRIHRVVCASPDCLDRLGRPEHPAALADLPTVEFRGASPAGRWGFVDAGRPLEVAIDPTFVCNQAATSIEACVAGLGFGSFLSYQVEAEVAAGRLVRVLEDFERPAVPVQLVFPHARLMSTRLRACVDHLKEAIPRARAAAAGSAAAALT